MRTVRTVGAMGAMRTVGAMRAVGAMGAMRTVRTVGAMGAMRTVGAMRAVGAMGAVRSVRSVARMGAMGRHDNPTISGLPQDGVCLQLHGVGDIFAANFALSSIKKQGRSFQQGRQFVV